MGDLFEIPLSKNRKAFGHYAFADKKQGPLIQEYDLIIPELIFLDLGEILKTSLRFPPIITGVSAAVRNGMWKIFAYSPIKDFEYPPFVRTLWDGMTGKAGMWFLWDGVREKKLGWKLPNKYKHLEYLMGWSPFDVVRRIETGEYPFPYKELIMNNRFTPKQD